MARWMAANAAIITAVTKISLRPMLLATEGAAARFRSLPTLYSDFPSRRTGGGKQRSRQPRSHRLNPRHEHRRSARRPVQRQLQLRARRGQPGAQSPGRLPAAPGRLGQGLFAQGGRARLRTCRRSGRPAQPGDPRTRRIPDAAGALGQGPARPGRLRADNRACLLARSRRPSRGGMGAGAQAAGARLGPHALRDLSALLPPRLPRAARSGAAAALLSPVRRTAGAVRKHGRIAARAADERRCRHLVARRGSRHLFAGAPQSGLAARPRHRR